MSHLAVVAPAPKRGTASHDFFKSSKGNIFAVREGLPIQEVLGEASCILAVAMDLCYRIADDTESTQTYGAAYLLEMAKGLLDAAIEPPQLNTKDDPADPVFFLREALADSQKQASQARTAKMRTYHDERASAFQIAIAALEG